MNTPSGHDDGERLAASVRADIKRLALAGLFTARYMRTRRVVRLQSRSGATNAFDFAVGTRETNSILAILEELAVLQPGNLAGASIALDPANPSTTAA
jgi:hypothetical protein